ncbi:MAG: endopeptidase La [Clostridia bacterium]
MDEILEINTKEIPVLALRGLVCIPGTFLTFEVTRKKSIKAINVAMETKQEIFVVCQKKLTNEEPTVDILNNIGTIAKIKQILKMPGGIVKVLIEGVCRASIVSTIREDEYLMVVAEVVKEQDIVNNDENIACIRNAQEAFDNYIDFIGKIPEELIISVLSEKNSGKLADLITANIPLDYESKQIILDCTDKIERLKMLTAILNQELSIMELEQKIHNEVQNQLEKNQKEYYIKEQIKALENELSEGDEEEGTNDLDKYKKQIEKLILNPKSKEKLLKEVKRLSRLPFGSQEGSVVRSYLDTVLELPWTTKTKDKLDIKKAEKVLNHDHYGLEKIKQRILEILAVHKITNNANSQILCLVGPPGVGKTSVGESIARAMGRKYVRISLGGVRDEAEIRGHRKTYLGSMPGRIIAAVASAGVNNPLILLDEVDKMGADIKGDPASALLEVLDPEQNKDFKDNFIEVPFDLSNVLFITTANTTDTIQKPLLDRMDIIELSSYTSNEKFHIATEYLVPKQLKKHGLTKLQLKFSDDAIRYMITDYTREAGVRSLERLIAKICRKTDKAILEGTKKTAITLKNITDFLGSPIYKDDDISKAPQIGVANGLAFTTVGGEILTIEVNSMEGTGKFELTGSLGDVMKESCKAAMSYIRSKRAEFGIREDFYKDTDIHIHFPEGAVPKDGPSAGITIALCIISELLHIPIRSDIAMTGEITIRGRVLPIGGLKEKTMAAYKHGLRTVIVPKANESDLEDIDSEVHNALTFIFAKTMEDVIKNGLTMPIGTQKDADFIVPEGKKQRKINIRQ